MSITSSTYFVAKILTSIGAFNWGLVGMFDFNLVAYLLGNKSESERAVYTIVGLSSLAVLASLLQNYEHPSLNISNA